MGLKEIFRKEERYLGSPKELPELASEKLYDSVDNNSFVETPKIPIPEKSVNQEKIEVPDVRPQEAPNQAPMQNSANNPVVTNQPPNYVNGQHPGFFPQQIPYGHFPAPYYPSPHFANFQHFPVQNHQQNMVPNYADPNYHYLSRAQFGREVVGNSERGPLRKLLFELDHLESRWHSLTGQKESLSKEVKYLESEIEHKMRLLRTHLAIANESNTVSDGDEFYLADGQILKSREDLVIVAKEMTKSIFDHHVGPGWNDFEAWVANCLHDYELAKKLKNINSVNELVSALKKY